ncbi:type VII secretion system-associated protein [Streptomyces sp. NPDC046988]|uniref:type VII secretion system-associated protein n=1 Tax=Streptomyces sp. NPDC046988 TaxID=3154922 RepID=UPI0033E58E7F
MPDTPETPEQEEPLADVPESVLEAARAAPGHWFGMVDPAWRGEGVPPNWAVVGRYRSSARGEVVQWQYNDGYRPSPAANGWPPPTDPVDEAIQLALSGYGPEDDVLGLLADAEVGVMIGPAGRPVEACSPDGTPVVPVFTSEPQLHSGGRYATRTVRVPDLVGELGEDMLLYVNPAGAVCMTVDPDDLVPRTAAEAWAEDPAEAGREEEDLRLEPEGQPEPELEPEGQPEPERDVEPDDGAQGSSTRQRLVDVLSGREL